MSNACLQTVRLQLCVNTVWVHSSTARCVHTVRVQVGVYTLHEYRWVCTNCMSIVECVHNVRVQVDVYLISTFCACDVSVFQHFASSPTSAQIPFVVFDFLLLPNLRAEFPFDRFLKIILSNSLFV